MLVTLVGSELSISSIKRACIYELKSNVESLALENNVTEGHEPPTPS